MSYIYQHRQSWCTFVVSLTWFQQLLLLPTLPILSFCGYSYLMQLWKWTPEYLSSYKSLNSYIILRLKVSELKWLFVVSVTMPFLLWCKSTPSSNIPLVRNLWSPRDGLTVRNSISQPYFRDTDRLRLAQLESRPLW